MRILSPAMAGEAQELLDRGEFFWLDLDHPSRETIDHLGRVLGLHELALEDTQEFGQRPKADVYDEQLLLVYFGASADETGTPSAVEIHLHISPRYVLSVHRQACPMFDALAERLTRTPPDSESALIYRIIDGLTDSVLDVMERVAEVIDEHASQVFHRPRARDRDRMAGLRRRLESFRRVVVTQRQVFDRLLERLRAIPGLADDYADYYRDVADHLWRAVDEIEAARESLQGMLETYANEVQERLTIVATIFLPLTVVTGFFGQNFNWMINHIGSAATFWGLGVGGMTASVLLIVLWLIRSGLYDRPRRGS